MTIGFHSMFPAVLLVTLAAATVLMLMGQL